MKKKENCPECEKNWVESGGFQILGWILRIFVSCIFIFSGFVKAIDPWGTLYKINDYLAAMSVSIWPNLVLVGVFCLCAMEFLIGIFFLFGCFRKSVCWVALLFMAVMLPLTLWIALFDPVEDCGCFGDAFIISNWATFIKNIFLTIVIVVLLRYNRKIGWIITPALQWLSFIFSALFIVIIELFGYISQPLIDFRPYKIGNSIIDSEQMVESVPDYSFLYKRDGEIIEISIDDTPPSESEGWFFVGRKENKQSLQLEKEKSLRLWDKTTGEDFTEDAIIDKGEQLIVMISDLSQVSPATTWKLNSLYEWCLKHNVSMIGVVAGNHDQIEYWEDISMASYPIYTAEDTIIKEVVRGNPGVVFLKDGILTWKSSLSVINIDDFMSPEISDDASSFGLDNALILRNCSYIYLSSMAFLIVLSFLPKMKDIYFDKRKMIKEVNKKNVSATHDDKVLPEE